MAQDISTSFTRRRMVAGLALSATSIALAGADNAYAQGNQTKPEKSLYERLGGVFAIAAVVDHFSDAVVKNPIVGQKSKNPQLREWHTKNPNGTELCMWVIRQRPLSRRKHAVARVRRFRKDRRPLHHQAVLARP